jgi:hypothetical protein
MTDKAQEKKGETNSKKPLTLKKKHNKKKSDFMSRRWEPQTYTLLVGSQWKGGFLDLYKNEESNAPQTNSN